MCNRARTNLTFDYGGQCSLLLNSGGWVHVPHVRYKQCSLPKLYLENVSARHAQPYSSNHIMMMIMLIMRSTPWSVWQCRCEASTRSVATCGANHTNSWQWGPRGRQCGASRMSSSQARYRLQQKWVVMAGDSITRFMFAALLRLLAEDGMLKLCHVLLVPSNASSALLAPPATIPDCKE